MSETRVTGCSVRGPAHVRDGSPGQDAWSAVAEPVAFAVACDGMGSRPLAHEGARAATRAALRAWRLWRRSNAGSPEDLVRLIEVLWRLDLGGIAPAEACTTCLVYAEDLHGRAVVAQLGDGLIVRRSPDGAVTTHPSRKLDFGTTHALGAPHTLADWSLAVAPPLAPGESLLLATDGVSEDLLRDRLDGLMRWLHAELDSRRAPHHWLRRELHRWPVAHHGDDKTLVMLRRS
ncbi:MAG: hypothetical protein EP329_08935 [Deltaproteobacteria bacterium]|nr:MAG: hypothetical protein EP329_08935 [Deltaproteobacteria bacterium]